MTEMSSIRTTTPSTTNVGEYSLPRLEHGIKTYRILAASLDNSSAYSRC